MKIDVRYPVLLRGTPRGWKSERDILLSYGVTVDVPEISPREMEVVFWTRETQRSDLLQLIGPLTIGTFDGRHYRCLDPAFGSAGHPGRFQRAFDRSYVRHKPDPRSFLSCSSLDDEHRSLLGRPIQNHLSLHLKLSDLLHEREITAWPSVGQFAMPERRNDFYFENYVSDLGGADMSPVEQQREMRDRQSSRLLIAGDSLWIEETPLCYMVSTFGWDADGQVCLEFGHMPTWFDADLTKRYFPLSRRDDAIEYANWSSAVSKRRINDQTGDWSCDDISQFDFDPGPSETAKLSLSLACDTKRALMKDGSRASKLSAGELDAVSRGYEAALQANYVLGDIPDLSDDFPDIVEAWSRLGRKPGLWGVLAHINRKAFFDRAIKDGLQEIQDRPITAPFLSPGEMRSP